MQFITKNKYKGFTLIELLVVIAIISLLSSVVLASLNSARVKARDARRLADIKQLQTALEFYFDVHNAYPSTSGNYQVIAGGSTALQVLVTEGFIAKVPSDPQSTNTGVNNNEYYYGSPGWWLDSWPYQIQFQLENRNDSAGLPYSANMWGVRYVYSVHP